MANITTKETLLITPDLLKSPYQKIINASASVFDEKHGRSFFSPQFYEKIEPYLKEVLTQPIGLECDLNTAKKTNRLTPLKQLFKACFGTEEILIVNNNTSAVFLIANALAQEKEIIVSYGELVGGDFNLKDILLSSGARLHLVGNINRAYLRDYRLALNENSKMLFKTHNPAFKKDTPFKDLQALAKEHDLIDYYNLGDVDLLDRTALEEILALKPSLLSFSADKSFNSVQAGIIMGQKEWVEMLKNHPLYRALRAGKITLTLLFCSLNAWVNHQEEITIHALLNQTDRKSVV